MNRILALLTAIALVFCLTACQQTEATNTNQVSSVSDTGDASSRQSVSRPSKKPTGSSSSSVTEEPFPESVSGKFQGKTVTVSCRARLKINYTEQFANDHFTNGYAAIRYDGRSYNDDGWVIINYDGILATLPKQEVGYIEDFSAFDKNGVAVIYQPYSPDPYNPDKVVPPAEYSFINTKGEILGEAKKSDFDLRGFPYFEYFEKTETTDGSRKIAQNTSPGSVYLDPNGKEHHTVSLLDAKGNIIRTFPDGNDEAVFITNHLIAVFGFPYTPSTLYDENGVKLTEKEFYIIGNEQHGLIPFVESGDSSINKVGFIDEKGSVIIPATFRSTHHFNVGISWSEGHIITYQEENTVSILQVTIQ